MPVLPDVLSSGLITGRFIVSVIDNEDPDRNQNVIAGKGKITFRASVEYIPIPMTSEGPVTMMKGPVTGVLDDEGYLCTPHPITGLPMYRGVKLLATDDLDMAVTGWTWNVTYQFESIKGTSLQIKPHSITVPSNSEQDLTILVKVPSSPGYGLPQSEAAVLRAEAIVTNMAAEVWITGTGATQKIHFRLPSGSKGDKGDQGDKGDPGGWAAATQIASGVDLNTITTPGLYVRLTGTGSGLNYPPNLGTKSGGLQVYQGAGAMVQEWTGTDWSENGSRTIWRRNSKGSYTSWTEWKSFVSFRVDNTVGKAVYMWDDTANREQLVYGDTGERAGLLPLYLNGATQSADGNSARISRDGYTVHLYLSVTVTNWIAGTAIFNVPLGFRPTMQKYMPPSYSVASPAVLAANGDVFLHAAGSQTYRFSWSWKTNDPWPTTLPGTAVGIIPYL